MIDTQGFNPSTPFEGYIKAKLEDIEKKLDNLPCPETFKRLNKIENELAGIKGSAAVIGGFASIAIVWIKETFWKN